MFVRPAAPACTRSLDCRRPALVISGDRRRVHQVAVLLDPNPYSAVRAVIGTATRDPLLSDHVRPSSDDRASQIS
jgi:hypothetical protein